MAGRGGEQVYATLLLNDTYLPGALVLAHSLRDAGTTKQLAVLVTLDSVSADVITQLKTVYDHIISVPRIRNEHPANLYLMNRADLHSAFTKINLWKQTSFSKIVYIDADVVALRAPDELFAIDAPFSAAPDIGWPDLFNTGVMVLTPNMGDYYAMMAMAERGISFDGADQGLLNMHFKNSYNRLSFTYNVTPSAHYQYVPAYRHFQSSINMVHFIGAEKPWFSGRNTSTGNSPHDEMVGRWWAVYDRHYRSEEVSPTPAKQTPELVQYFVKGEFHPGTTHSVVTTEQIPIPVAEGHPPPPAPEVERRHEQVSHPPPEPSWDAQRQPPPLDSKPEAINFPHQVYEMSEDVAPFVPPERYPSPPKNMWYEVPKEPPAPHTHKPRAIFPWETHQPRASRIFISDTLNPSSTDNEETATDVTVSSTAEQSSEPLTPVTPTARVSDSDPWDSFTRSNAWDEVPEIERYVEGLPWHRRAKSHGSASLTGGPKGATPGGEVQAAPWRQHGLRLTDFPTEVERPSLPVTPAPIRRPKFWGGGDPGDGDGKDTRLLPAAEGVPAQPDWDPVEQLQKLARQQSEFLLQKLGGTEHSGVGREIPSRPLPFGSEGVVSPTYVKQTSAVLSPQPVKGGTTTSKVRSLGEGQGEGGEVSATSAATPFPATATITEPSYHGPGAAWEKGEDIPVRETPALATEEERDILET